MNVSLFLHTSRRKNILSSCLIKSDKQICILNNHNSEREKIFSVINYFIENYDLTFPLSSVIIIKIERQRKMTHCAKTAEVALTKHQVLLADSSSPSHSVRPCPFQFRLCTDFCLLTHNQQKVDARLCWRKSKINTAAVINQRGGRYASINRANYSLFINYPCVTS
jgi:hypothetical protein